jgi:hypothetical protein
VSPGVATAGATSGSRPRPTWAAPAAGAVIGAAFLLWLAGRRPIDPTEIGWVMHFDWVPHYFGWHYFRTEPWHWPPGRVEGYYAPFGTAIGLTDSIPLAAYLFKPLSPWLPPHFQYLGLWWLLSFTLQGAFAARLLGRWIASVPAQVLGATLFVLLPTLLARVAHAALCSHWLILWTLLIATRDTEARLRWREWATIGLLAGMIQPYLAAMALALLGATALATAAAPVARRAGALAASMAATVLGWWLSGLFTLTEGGALSAEGLGVFSMNLLAFVSPAGWSRVMPALPIAGVGQEVEGFHYLGLGLLLLVGAAAALRLGRAAQRWPAIWPRPIVAVAALMTAFAICPRVTFGATVLVDLTGPWAAPLALFRSSGRFVWPLTYLLVTWTIVTVARRLSAAAVPWTLAAVVAVQVADLQHIYRDRRQATHDPAFYAWEQPFRSERWPQIARHYRHVVLAPPPQCRPAPLPLSPVIRFAAEHRLTVNSGVLSRHEERARARYCETLADDVDAGRLDAQSLYLVPADRAAAIRAARPGAVVCGVIDAVTVCSSAATYASWRDLAVLE